MQLSIRGLVRAPFHIGCVCVLGMALLGARQAAAQQMALLAELPDAPDAASAQTGNATLSGKVIGPNGAAMEGASITLIAPGVPERSLVSDTQGEFAFRALPSGTYRLTVMSPGLQSYTNPEIPLKMNETLLLPPIALSLTGETSVVQVNATTIEIAQEQVQEQEKQRVLGVFPNFYSSYVWDAAPLNTRQKFNLAAHSIFDPVTFVVVGLAAGGEEATNTYGQYGQGAQGYAKRYGATYTDAFLGRMLGSAVLPSLLHQDPRYFYKGPGATGRQRILYALSRAVVTRGDNGKSQFNYSHILGDFGAGAISNAYYPSHDRGVGLTITNGFLSLAGAAADNLIREFVLRDVTKNVPDYKQGQQTTSPGAPANK